MALKVLLCSGDDKLPRHCNVLRAIHTRNSPINYPACWGNCPPSIQCFGTECKASCGVLGCHLRPWQPWLAMVVLVNVGRWRLTSDPVRSAYCKNSKNCLQKYYFIPT
jgi:hypothetical protein